MENMVEVVIDSVRVSLMSSQRVVVLRQTSIERYLPIWVGPFEAESITVALQEVEVSRPMTHDLMKTIIATLSGKIARVEIVALKEDIYFGNIVVEVNGRQENIDARASDAIALALRAHVPILVDQAVMDAAGIVPEKNIQEEIPSASPAQPEAAEEVQPGDEERLDVFEDFLKKLKPDQDQEEKPAS